MELIALPSCFYIEKGISLFHMCEYTSWMLLVCANLLYFFSVYLPSGLAKFLFFIFSVMMISFFSTINVFAISGLCSRFTQNDMVMQQSGLAFSGLATNIMMIIVIIFSSGVTDSFKLYKYSMIILNIFSLAFLGIQMVFFHHCKLNHYVTTEQVDLENELVQANQINVPTSPEDHKLNYDPNTISYMNLLKIKFQHFFGLALDFFHTLFIFPVLFFRM